MAFFSLVIAVQSNFCNLDVIIAHKFSMGLRSGEFPGHFIESNKTQRSIAGMVQLHQQHYTQEIRKYLVMTYGFVHAKQSYSSNYFIRR